MVYLQSFFSEPRATPYSVARWQPRGYRYPELRVLAPLLPDGRPIKRVSPDKYLDLYAGALASRWQDVKKTVSWLKKVDAALCCWCNPERQKGYEKLFCHTILIGFLLEEAGVPVVYLDGREKPVWDEADRARFLKILRAEVLKRQ
ncbi:hypothetical protein SAMN00808754_1668 [Thermanaeromonas toyohensis ToBE]|uniref:DUF488 domain-containing protein n=1 Tax=Thermanaeromonas toyohensis ToBE TaxID=698762 RepID=A0A1W1VU06_9FIRM|nr:hypothetical protein SAMN00808754_1668 [Thermanaeromonas toyohensis ToBE]